MRKRARLAVPVAAAIATIVAAVPAAAVDRHPIIDTDPVTVVVIERPDSVWELSVDTEENLIVVRHREHTDVGFEIDWDWFDDDGRYDGIAPYVGCQLQQGQFFFNTAPLIYPILEPFVQHTERLLVETAGNRIRVRFEGGSYEMLQEGGGDDPLFMDATFVLTSEGLTADLRGLYYLLPWQEHSTVHFAGPGLDETRVIAEVPPSIEYFDGVTSVEVQDGRFGDWRFRTNVERLQLQVHDSPGVDVVELDFDHTFKDLGQRSAHTRLTLPVTTQPDPSCVIDLGD